MNFTLLSPSPNLDSALERFTSAFELTGDMRTVTERSLLGRTTVLTLDDHGRPIAITVLGLASSELTYDGSLLTETRVEPGNYRVHRDHDDHLRLGRECLNGTCSLVGGVCMGGVYPITLGYDLDGMLTQAGELTLARDPQNGLVLGSSVGVVHENLTPNAHGERESYAARTGDPDTGEVLLAVDYVRDALGRIVQRTETFGASAGGGTRVFEYGYDLAGRLQAVSEDGVHIAQYEYDANGNRLSASDPSLPGSDVAGEYDAQDRLLTYGVASYTYSANGELVQKATPNGTTTYTYDVLGNLRGVVLPDGREITYTVDGESHRLWKAIDGVRVQGFLWRGALQVVAELDGAGNVVARFVYGDEKANVPDYMVRQGGTYRILKDHLGSPRLVAYGRTGLQGCCEEAPRYPRRPCAFKRGVPRAGRLPRHEIRRLPPAEPMRGASTKGLGEPFFRLSSMTTPDRFIASIHGATPDGSAICVVAGRELQDRSTVYTAGVLDLSSGTLSDLVELPAVFV